LQLRQAALGIVGMADHKARSRQVVGHHARQALIVFDHQQRSHLHIIPAGTGLWITLA